MLPIERLKDERHGIAPASTEDERADRHAFAFFDIGIQRRVVAHRRGETAVRMRGFFFRSWRPIVATPINRVRGRRAVFAFPPNIAVIGQSDICIKRVMLDRFHRVRIRFVTRARHDAEVTVLRIDREKPAIANLHPGDVVADGRHFPAAKMFRRNEHGKIGFATRAREGCGHVMLATLRRLDAEDEHVFRHPALPAGEIRTDAQRETFFAEQNISAVAGANRDDRVVLWKMADETPRRIDI